MTRATAATANHRREFTPAATLNGRLLQRKCACGMRAEAGECQSCRRDHERKLQRAPAGSIAADEVPDIVYDVLRTPGHRLDPTIRADMESRFERDFSHVRVHTDAEASQSARAVNALAYTVGPQIAFAHGQYRPANAGGRQLIAHELAHVVQQGVRFNESISGRLELDRPDTTAERDAGRIAGEVTLGHGMAGVASHTPASASTRAIQRQPEPQAEGSGLAGRSRWRTVAAFDDEGKRRPMTVTRLLKLLEPYLRGERGARYTFLATLPSDTKDPDAPDRVYRRAEKWRDAIVQMIDQRRWPAHLFNVAFSQGTAADPQIAVVVQSAPTVLSTGPGGTGPGARGDREPKSPGTPSGAEFKPPLTVIVNAAGGQVLNVSIPESLTVSTPPLGGARRIVVTMTGGVTDLLKLMKPEEKPAAPAPVPDEAPQPAAPPVKPGPPVSAGLSISMQATTSATAKLSGTYNLETRQVTAGLSFVITTPHGDCALPSGAAGKIADAIQKLEKFGVKNRAAQGGNPLAAGPKPPEGAPPPEMAPSLSAEDVPEAAVTVGKAIATLVEQMDAIKKAQDDCKKRKPAKAEFGPSLTVPTGEQAPGLPRGLSGGVNLKIFFD